MNLTQALKTLKENKFICERTEEIDYKEKKFLKTVIFLS